MVQELDACSFQDDLDLTHDIDTARQGAPGFAFHVSDCVDVDAGLLGNGSLIEARQGSGRLELVSGCEHT